MKTFHPCFVDGEISQISLRFESVKDQGEVKYNYIVKNIGTSFLRGNLEIKSKSLGNFRQSAQLLPGEEITISGTEPEEDDFPVMDSYALNLEKGKMKDEHAYAYFEICPGTVIYAETQGFIASNSWAFHPFVQNSGSIITFLLRNIGQHDGENVRVEFYLKNTINPPFTFTSNWDSGIPTENGLVFEKSRIAAGEQLWLKVSGAGFKNPIYPGLSLLNFPIWTSISSDNIISNQRTTFNIIGNNVAY